MSEAKRGLELIGALVVVAVFFAACAKEPRPVDRRVEAEWNRNMKIVETSTSTDPKVRDQFSLEEQENAREFFRRLTGIAVMTQHTSAYLGSYEADGTAEAIGGWQEWYRCNGRDLVWDEATQQVVVRPVEREEKKEEQR